ncbi:guanylate kinase [Candidatus Termititenax persephonae]|uniref:Guanylate kinase n=1 Tax=Candidatus Termititenax persephonae TaxID=2218525 RepID=A0A388TEJ6_9BACT|nr:guanylate kinase [Candidatus Termititenax persephonae]
MLFVISGPSGVGKGTVIQEILKTRGDLSVSVSYTSRPPRADEADGVNYCFVSCAVFEQMIADGEFLEYAQVHGNYYGTGRTQVRKMLSAGKNVLFEVDVQGGINLRLLFKELRSIFILPPSARELVRRIKVRGSETEETLRIRLAAMRGEIGKAREYDYQVVNRDLDTCVQEINKIINKEIKAKAIS